MWTFKFNLQDDVDSGKKINGFNVTYPVATIMNDDKIVFKLYSENGYIITDEIAEDMVNALNSGNLKLGDNCG